MKPQLTIHLQPHSSADERSIIYRILTYFIAAFFILVVAVSALFILAKDAMPTDSYYPMKRTGENVLLKLFSFDQKMSLNIKLILLQQRILETEQVLLSSHTIFLVNNIIEEVKVLDQKIIRLPVRADRLHYYEGLKNMLIRQDNLLTRYRQSLLTISQNDSLDKIATVDMLKAQIEGLRNDILNNEQIK